MVVATDALGKARPEIALDGAGPFLVEIDAEAPLDDGPPAVSGFARPAQTEVRPFGAVIARWAVPARLGELDIAFLGASADGRVWGTHLHGLFESGPARRHVLDWARGAPAVSGAPAPPDHRALREAAYDRLADALADALDEQLLSDLGVS